MDQALSDQRGVICLKVLGVSTGDTILNISLIIRRCFHYRISIKPVKSASGCWCYLCDVFGYCSVDLELHKIPAQNRCAASIAASEYAVPTFRYPGVA